MVQPQGLDVDAGLAGRRVPGVDEVAVVVPLEVPDVVLVQQRVQAAVANKPFVINVTDSARKFLLTESIDLRYGARPLKRAIERLLPLSSQATLAILGRRMSAQIRAAFGDTAERLEERRRARAGRGRASAR